MKVRRVKFAFVSAAFLAAFATTCGAALANPSSANTELTRRAYEAMQGGDNAGAIRSFSQAIESRTLEPEVLANALLNRALAFQQLGAHDRAIDDYSAALSLDAMSPGLRATALYNRGLSQQQTGQLPIAIEDFTSALLLNPEFAHAFFGRGNALRDSGQLLFALSDYERALRYKHPEPAKVHFGSAVTFMALRRPQDARRALNAALEINPEYAAARQQLAKLDGGIADTEASLAGSDPILTGSIAALSGGTVARKPTLPVAVDVPASLDTTPAQQVAAAKPKARKLYVDRVPVVEQVAYNPAEAEGTPDSEEQIIAVEEVPPIPEPGQTIADEAAIETKNPEVLTEDNVEPKVAAAEADVPAAEPPDTLPVSGWVVQLASASSEDAAWSTWSKMQKRHSVLADLKPIVVKADLGAKGIFYRVRLSGYADQSSAKQACTGFKSSGVACYISKS